MEKKVKVSIRFMCLVIAVFLLSCGVKGDPEEPKIETNFLKNNEIYN
mgnify:CR=1 FL=1|tara:strand:+ start:2193 stop:2333 length:141 start_codon:yes stop_codon:yes gene_type:complete